MIFNTALVAALAFSWLLAILTLLVGGSARRAVTSATVNFVVVFFLDWWVIYAAMPQFQGTLWGYGSLIMCDAFLSLVIAGISAVVSDDEKGRNASVFAAFCMCAIMALDFVQGAFWASYYTWGPNTKTYYASFVNMKMAGPNDRIPPSDTDHMKLTPADVACTKAGQALGQNASLSSIFKIDCGELTPQSINNHVWYIAPLEYQSGWSQGGSWGAPYYPGSPGYVKVDGEDPMAAGQLVVGDKYHMNYFPSAMWDNKLERHLYNLGYNQGVLDDFGPEADDNGKLWFTGTYNVIEGGMGGERITKVLIVDPVDGKPQEYELGHAPEWVDRLVSSRLQKTYVNDYLKYGWKKEALANYSYWFNNTGNQFKIQDMRITFNGSSQHPMALMTITSNDNTNDAVVGVVVCATNNNDCTLFDNDHMPNVQPASHAQSACDAAAQARNIKLQRDDTQLHFIVDRLTWMAIYVTPGAPGISGICMVDATQGKTSGANAVYASDLRTTLYLYSQKLLEETTGDNTKVGTVLGTVEHVHGHVKAVGGFVNGGNSFVTLVVAGDDGKAMMFIVNPLTMLPVTALSKGDEVTVDYRLMTGMLQPMPTKISSPVLQGIPEEQMRFAGSGDAKADTAAAPK